PPEPGNPQPQEKSQPPAASTNPPSPPAAQNTPPPPAHATAPQITLHQLTKPPTIDAQLDDWNQKLTELPVKAAHHQEETDKSAHAFAGWTDKGIYLAAVIPADGLNPLDKNWYSGDAVEIFFGR